MRKSCDKVVQYTANQAITLNFLQKAMVQYNIFKTILLYLLKVYPLYEHQQETLIPFLAIFCTFN